MAVTYTELIAALDNVANAQTQGQMLGDLQGILDGQNIGLADQVKQDSDLSTILRYVGNIDNNVAALITQVGVLTANLTAIGLNIPPIGTPVVLPDTPPAWYVVPPAGISAADVWNYVADIDTPAAIVMMRSIANYAVQLGSSSQNIPQKSPFFEYTGDLSLDDGPANFYTPPQPHVSTILLGDTVLTWLTRVLPLYGWVADYLGSDRVGGTLTDAAHGWICLLTPSEFAELQGALFPPASANIPPVWPGLAKVTLGAPLALVDGLFIPGPMDGCLITIATVPYPVSYYPFGPYHSFVKAGALMFATDDEDGEFPQSLGPDRQVLTPKSMKRAGFAYLRLTSGVTGTITPWTIT